MLKLLFLVATLVALSFCDTESVGIECKKRKTDIHCCNDDIFNKAEFENLLEFKRECFKEIWGPEEEPTYDPFNSEQIREVKEQAMCHGECISKKKDLVDEKGYIKRNTLIEHLNTVYKDTEWTVKAIEGIVDKCSASFNKTTVDDYKCNPSPMHFVHCMWKEFILACPTELQSDDLKCKKIREKIEKLDDNYLNREHFFALIRQHQYDTANKVKV